MNTRFDHVQTLVRRKQNRIQELLIVQQNRRKSELDLALAGGVLIVIVLSHQRGLFSQFNQAKVVSEKRCAFQRGNTFFR